VTKLKYRKEADPYLQTMVSDLNEAIQEQKLHMNIEKASEKFLDETAAHVIHLHTVPSESVTKEIDSKVNEAKEVSKAQVM
jgi:hypothetical protein